MSGCTVWSSSPPCSQRSTAGQCPTVQGSSSGSADASEAEAAAFLAFMRAQANGGKIPGRAALSFEVELLEVKEGGFKLPF